MVARQKWVDDPVLYKGNDSATLVTENKSSLAKEHGQKGSDYVQAPPILRPDEPQRSPRPHEDLMSPSPEPSELKLLPHQWDKATATKLATRVAGTKMTDSCNGAGNQRSTKKSGGAHTGDRPPQIQTPDPATQAHDTKHMAHTANRRQQVLETLAKKMREKEAAAEADRQSQLSAIQKARDKQKEHEKQLQLAREESLEATLRSEMPIAPRISEVDAEPQVGLEATPAHLLRDWNSLADATGWPNTWDEREQLNSVLCASLRAADVSERDPRGLGLTMPSIHVDWNAARPKGKNRRNWDIQSTSSAYGAEVAGNLLKFVPWWRARIPVTSINKKAFTKPNHCFCDIDIETGKLLEPIDYSDTLPSSDKAERRLPPTALDAIADAWIARNEQGYQRPSYGHDEWDAHDEVNSTEAMLSTTPGSTATTEKESLKSTEIKVRCHLRPAAKADVPEVMSIYNQEVRSSHRTLDSQEITLNDFRKLFDKCKAENMPFLVAIEGDWKPDGEWPFTLGDKIIGFALVDTLEYGLWGSRNNCSSTCGRVTLMVHADYRQQRVGTALLDMIMKSCSCLHQPWEGYTWIQPEPANPDKRFTEPLNNLRKWYTLSFEVLVRSNGKPGDKLQEHGEWWVCEWLETRFSAYKTEHKERFYRHSSNDQKGTYWLDRINLLHTCRSWNS